MTRRRKSPPRRAKCRPPEAPITPSAHDTLTKARPNQTDFQGLDLSPSVSEPNRLIEAALGAPDANALPVPVEEIPTVPVAVGIPLALWHISGAAVTGLAHWKKGLPCQDAMTWRNSTRPILILSDGAGSAAISERGANALVSGISRFLVSLEDALSLWLDDPAKQPPEQAVFWVRRLLIHAEGILNDLAQAERRSVRDLRATLLVAVVGTALTFWWQVGDGAIVVRQSDGLRALGDTSKAKGEFANQTCFVDTASSSDVQFGLLPTANVFGLALMSDGGAEKLVSSDGSRVAPRIGEWFEAVTQETLTPDKIALAFSEPAMWERTSLDDRSIVLMARTAVS